MNTFIAGKDALEFDKSDWDISTISVWLNSEGLPPTTSIEEASQMITRACFSWNLRNYIGMVFAGLTSDTYKPGGVVVKYANSEFLFELFQGDVTGLCKYHTKGFDSQTGKHILEGCQVYINADNRPLPNQYSQATIKHELGHACGIHGHAEKYGCVMYKSSHGHTKLTLDDCQMLDSWSPYAIEIHEDSSLTIPAAHHPDGRVLWIELQHNGRPLIHSWRMSVQREWDGPPLNNLTVETPRVLYRQMCDIIHLKHAASPEMTVWAEIALAPNGNLLLVYAE